MNWDFKTKLKDISITMWVSAIIPLIWLGWASSNFVNDIRNWINESIAVLEKRVDTNATAIDIINKYKADTTYVKELDIRLNSIEKILIEMKQDIKDIQTKI